MGSWRVWRTILIIVVILGGLFYAADWFAVRVVEDRAAEKARTSEGLEHKPKLSIDHFPRPFLTQVLFGKIKHVSIKAEDVNADGGRQDVRITTFTADLYGVKLTDNFSRATADRATGDAFVSYDDLSKSAPPGVKVSAAPPAADGTARVKLSASLPGLGSGGLSVFSRVQVSGQKITLHAESMPKEITALGLEKSVRAGIDFDTNLTHLPSGISLTKAVGTATGMDIKAAGRNVELVSG
ncbi:DUF2993 domain-containing protein [Streptomyces sp. NPDC021224]|uniref:LmeA family phospholipid-binding protein n=1 Tax=unclassified Streptomyces TaxID=2593676 RepID=UPI0037A15C08